MRQKSQIVKKIIAILTTCVVALPTMPAYAKTEDEMIDEVQIHTPVMSPGTIYGGDGSPANREDRGEVIPTSLVSDISKPDTANLRLDQFYYIKWKDLSELTNDRYEERDRKHRDGQDEDNTAATPDLGGYVHETDDDSTEALEEDQFTRNKYMKFPFEVFYDGNFYKANQWILIHKPADTHTSSGGEDHYYSGWSRDPNPTVNPDGSLSSDNHWVYTPFYIPTWAKEGLYEDIEMPSDKRYSPDEMTSCVQLRVEAINSEGETRDGTSRAEELQKIANTFYNVEMGTYDDGAAYVAIFNMPAQLSGWIYGFTITGTSDYDTFSSQSISDLTSQKVSTGTDYSFTANKQDKKSGVLNRLGWPALRYAKDGTIAKSGGVAAWDPVNTVALDGAWKDTSGTMHYGKSNAWKYMGTVPMGTTFSFTLKTISNMWNFNGLDEIRITPSFTYRKYDRTENKWISRENKDLKVYYTEDGKSYIPYGSNTDKATLQTANLGNKQFDQSYYTEEDTVGDGSKRYGDWITYVTYWHNILYGLIPKTTTLANYKQAVKDGSKTLPDGAITPQKWLTEKHAVYCLSEIKIGERLRLLSGEADQLKVNNYKNGYDVTDIAYQPYKGYATYASMADDFSSEYTGRFDSGEYSEPMPQVPDIIMNGAVQQTTMADKFRYSIQSWYGKYYVPEDLYVIDLTEHPEFRDFSDPSSPYHGSQNADGTVTMPDGRKYFDYLEYYATEDYKNKDGLQKDEDIFLQDGFLCVNFDIIAVKQGEDHLRYTGPNNGEWGAEKYQEVPDDPSKIAPPETGRTEDGVPTDPGDTIVVDLSKKYSDRYRAGLFNIN